MKDAKIEILKHLGFNPVFYSFEINNNDWIIITGPTGVGKTELAKSLAEAMFGDENSMIRMMHNVVNWNAVLWQVEYRQKHGKKAYEQLMRKHGIKM